MAEAVYVLCAVTSIACAALLFRSYRGSGMRLILWTALCFVLLGIQNVMLFIDLVIVPDLRLSLLRNLVGLAGVGVLLYGLIKESP